MANDRVACVKIENELRKILHVGESAATGSRILDDQHQGLPHSCELVDKDSESHTGISSRLPKNADKHSNFINHTVTPEKSRANCSGGSENMKKYSGKKEQMQQHSKPNAYRQHQPEMAKSPGKYSATNARKGKFLSSEENIEISREGRQSTDNERMVEVDQDNRRKKNRKKKDRKTGASNEPLLDGNDDVKTTQDSEMGEGKKSKRKLKWERVDMKLVGANLHHQEASGKTDGFTSSSRNVLGSSKNQENIAGESYQQNLKQKSKKTERGQQPQLPVTTLMEENKPPPEVLEMLAKNYIYPLKKRYTKFPKALYYCRLCEYHCDTIQVCNRHMNDNRHLKNKTNKELEITLRSLPDPYQPHTESVTELLVSIERLHGLSDDEQKQRLDLIDELNQFVVNDIPGFKLRLYGSSLSKFGLKDSDLNIDLLIQEKNNPAEGLMSTFKKLETHPGLTNVKSDFTAKIPSIYFTDSKSKFRCVVNLNNVAAYKTARLLADYVSIDPRVRTLGIAFRYWAKLCMIDEQEKGTLPSYSFSLMLIYFLQQHDPPVLPVLHELISNKSESYLHPDKLPEVWTCKNTQSVGELWIELFKFYSVSFKMLDFIVSVHQLKPMLRSEKMWSSKRIAIEDPYANKRNIARSISNQLVADYIFERFKMTYKYFGIPQTKRGPLFDKLLLVELEDKREKRSSSAKLFMDVLENIASKSKNDSSSVGNIKSPVSSPNKNDRYANDAALSVTIKSNNRDSDGSDVKKESKDSKNGKNLSVKKEINFNEDKKMKSGPNVLFSADEDSQILNCSRDDMESELSESTSRLCDDDSEQESCILNSLMEVLDDESDGKNVNKEDKNLADEILNESSLIGRSESHFVEIESGNRRISESSGKHDSMDSDNDVEEEEDDSGDKIENVTGIAKEQLCNGVADNSVTNKRKLPEDIEKKLADLSKDDLLFKFERHIFTGGKVPLMFCGLCQQEGHLKQNCPNEQLPPVLPLPPMNRDFMSDINEICSNIYTEHNPTSKETEDRKKILLDLQDFIRQIYSDAQLELFGSSCNGFGFACSDLDICLTFTKQKSGEDLKFIQIIENLAEKLKKHKELSNVIAITTAKVPIVKFTHRASRLEGDVSLYNTLAQHNTRMLNMYSEIDIRVKILGYVMKVFAKLCNIGDASRGSLSSYAYILMVIYFLQQRKPPVIPVLQELYDKDKPPPQRMVDGWNAWFFEDKENLKKAWPELGRNEESIGQLWLGLLCYYTEVFRFQEHVISIRQLKPLTRFEKLWNSKCIAIEDPFDLQHNLGAGVSRKMNNYIMKAFIQGRKLFGTPIARHLYRSSFNLHRILFNSATLTDGAPPNDRGCRLCGKIGHIVKECPRRKANKTREKAGQEFDRGRDRDHDRGHDYQRDKKATQNLFGRNRPPLTQPPLTQLEMAMVQQQQLMNARKGQLPSRPIMYPPGLRPESVMIPVMMSHGQPRPSNQQNLKFFSFPNSEKQGEMIQHNALERNVPPHTLGDIQKNFSEQSTTKIVAALPLSQPIVHSGIGTNKFLPQPQPQHQQQQHSQALTAVRLDAKNISLAGNVENFQSGRDPKQIRTDNVPQAEQTYLKSLAGRNLQTAFPGNHSGLAETEKTSLDHVSTANPTRTIFPQNLMANQQGRIDQIPMIRQNLPSSVPPGFTHMNVNYRMQLPQPLQQQSMPSGERQTNFPCLPQHGSGQEMQMPMHLQTHSTNLPLQPPFAAVYGKMGSGENIRLMSSPTHQQVPATSSSTQFPSRSHQPALPPSSQQYAPFPQFPLQFPRQFVQLCNLTDMSTISMQPPHQHQPPQPTAPSSALPFSQAQNLSTSVMQEKLSSNCLPMRPYGDMLLPTAPVERNVNQMCVLRNTHSPNLEASTTSTNSRTLAACFGSPRSSFDSGSYHSVGSDSIDSHSRVLHGHRDGSVSD